MSAITTVSWVRPATVLHPAIIYVTTTKYKKAHSAKTGNLFAVSCLNVN